MSVTPDAIRQLLDELEANRQSRKSAWATLQRLRKFLESTGAKISTPDDRKFETEGEALESGLKRRLAGRDDAQPHTSCLPIPRCDFSRLPGLTELGVAGLC